MKINEFLEDPSGKFSGMRLAILIWVVNICFNATYLTIMNNEKTGIDASWITGLGILISGKAVQNYSENKKIAIDAGNKTAIAEAIP